MRVLFSIEAADGWVFEAYKAFFRAMQKHSGTEVLATSCRLNAAPEVLAQYNVIDYACASNQRMLEAVRSMVSATDQATREQANAARVWSGPEQIIEKLAFFKTVLGLVQPDVVVGWNGMADIRLLARQAVQKAGIPYLYAEKGMLPESWCIDPAGINANNSVDTGHMDRNLDDSRRQKLLQYIDTIAASGTSAWDQPARGVLSDLRSQLGIAPDARIVFFPGQVDEDINITTFSSFKSVIQAVEAVASSLPEQTVLLVKPHPKNTTQSQQTLVDIAQRSTNIIVKSDINVWDAIEVCDLVVSINSTTAFEALLRGKQVIVLGDGILARTSLVPKTSLNDLAGRIVEKLSGTLSPSDLHKALSLIDFLVNEYYMFRDEDCISLFALPFLKNCPEHPHLFTCDQLMSGIYGSCADSSERVTTPVQTPSTVELSVILTTCNRQDLLKTVLEGFAAQTAPRRLFEVIVVDDGSKPPAKEIVASFADRLDVRYIYQENSGLAAARNAGIKAVSGNIVLFHDDDDLPDPDLIAEHIKSHSQNPDENILVLGHLDWHPSLTVTPLMHYITHEGGQYFGYGKMADGHMYDAWKWWGGLISAKASLLRSVEGPFDGAFRFGHEDTELVCRLRPRGLKVLYNASAKKLILRLVTFEDFCSRRIRQGRAMYHLAYRHPDVVVKRYGLDKVEEEYATHYQQNLQRWHDVLVEYEPAFNSNPQPIIKGTDPSTSELHKYWALCFRGYMLKGYLEEASVAASAASTMTSSVTFGTADAAVQAPGPAHIERQPIQIGEPKAVQTVDCLPILFICPTLPRPDVGSSNVRVHHILNILTGQGRKVDLIYFGQSADDQRYTDSWADRINIRHMAPKTSEVISLIESSQPRPACVWMTNLWNPMFCESMYKVAKWLKKTLPGIPLVIDTMDHHAAKFRRQFEHSHSDGDEKIAKMFESVEAMFYPLADRIITVTETESRSISEAVPGCSFSIIPNIHILREGNPGFEARRNICFIGSLKITHNADAVKWFISEVFPTIQSRLPDVEFHILGFGNDAYRQLFEAHQGVKVVGYVPDAEAAVSQYRLLVCPLVYGAGMKGKLGTAACSGTPFVTTTIGAEGFGLANGTDCFIVDRPVEFAAGCILLYNDQQLWKRFAANTRQKFASAFSPATVAPTVERIMADLLSRSSTLPSVQSMARDLPGRVSTLLGPGSLALDYERSGK
jgi:glycosyltransferase involved in cell wall biosynthesis